MPDNSVTDLEQSSIHTVQSTNDDMVDPFFPFSSGGTVAPNRQAEGRCLVLEIFAGSCRLAKACREVGFSVQAVDKDPSRAERFKVFQCDITQPAEYKHLVDFLEVEKDSVLHSHFAPSCGTASRARERPIPGLSPEECPRPLRSDLHPDGLPELTPNDQERVRQANLSYDVMCNLIEILVTLGCSVSIENPIRSLFWKYSRVKKLLQKYPGHFSYFHHCMHGGDRDKETAWWSFDPRNPQKNLFQSLELRCDGSHTHKTWRPFRDSSGKTIFPTQTEAAYPHLLCERVAHILKTAAIERGFQFLEDLDEQLQQEPHVAQRQLFTSQPRGQKLKPLVSEYGYYLQVCCPLNDDADWQQFVKTLPKGSKICHRVLVPGGFSRDDIESKNMVVTSAWCPNVTCEKFSVGIPREPLDFVADAVRKGHPRDMIASAPEEIKSLVKDLLSGDSQPRFEKRAAFMKRWLKRSLDLKQDESRLHESLPKHLKKILAGKRLLLWREILQDLQYADVAVIDDIISGFSLTGWAPKTHVFHTHVRKPQYSVDQLMKMSPGFNAAVLGSLSGSSDSPHDSVVWEETMQEVAKGWIEPCDDNVGTCIAKRFPVPQRNKVRMIDDFSICGVNAAYGLREKLRVQAVDELCSYLAIALDDLKPNSSVQLVGRTYDLKSAYKQFGVDQWHADHLRIAVKQPGVGVKTFKVLALPFGATGSVTSFLRVAAALTFIGIHAFSIVWTSFFDDFTVVATADEVTNISFYIESLFKLLGVWYAAEGDKAPPFSANFKTLGLQMDLSDFVDGHFTLMHTDSRKLEIIDTIRALRRSTDIGSKDLERLHGRLVWYRSFVFGRKINRLVARLSQMSTQKHKVLVGDELAETLELLEHHLEHARPIPITKSICRTWFIYTDGAYEPGNELPGSIGGVLVDPQGNPVEMFGEYLPEDFMNSFLEYSDHPIYELEILPLVVALHLWSPVLLGSPVVFFLDNNAARSAFIRAVGATKPAQHLVDLFISREERLRILSWFGRVPTHSNISDAPSRLVFNESPTMRCQRKRVVFPSHFSTWGLAQGVMGSNVP